jgi:hypothetical protein
VFYYFAFSQAFKLLSEWVDGRHVHFDFFLHVDCNHCHILGLLVAIFVFVHMHVDVLIFS